MRLRRNPAALLLGLLWGGGLSRAQTADQILAQVADTYRSLNSYRIEGTIRSETDVRNSSYKSESEFVVAFAEPDRFRIEYRYPSAGTWLRTSDGKLFTTFRSISNQFHQEPADSSTIRVLRSSPIALFETIDRDAKNPVLAGSETIALEGQNHDCDVIRYDGPPRTLPTGASQLPNKVWIDKGSHLVLRQVTGTLTTAGAETTKNERTTQFTKIRVNEPLAATLFAVAEKARP